MMFFKRRDTLYPGLIVITILLIATLFTGCKKVQDKEPIKIGFIGVLTGVHATTGIRGRNAVVLAVEQINAKGGINGRKIELIIKDGANIPEKGIEAFKELKAEGVVAIVGHVTSTNTVALVPYVNETDILMFGDASSPVVSGQDDQYFRVDVASDQTGRLLADLAVNEIKIKKLGVIYDLANAGFTEVIYNFFRKQVEVDGGELVSVVTFDSRESFSIPQLVKELGDVEGVLIVGGVNHMAIITQHIRNLDPAIEIIIPYFTAEYLETGGPQTEGVYSASLFNKALTNERLEELKRAYNERFSQEMDRVPQQIYETTIVIFDVLKRADDSKTLKETLMEKRVYEGLTTKLIFDDYGDIKRTQYIITIEGGVEKVVGAMEPDIAGN